MTWRHVGPLVLLLSCADTTTDPTGTSGGGQGDATAGSDAAFGADSTAGADAPDVTAGTDATPLGPLCAGPEDCETDQVCDCHGACVPKGVTPCVEHKNCGATATNFCDPCTGFCGVRKGVCQPCEKDWECEGEGSACLDLASGGRVCGAACVADPGCPKGFLCQAISNVKQKQCLPQSGSCEKPGDCAKDADCPFPTICNLDLLVCAEGCPDDDACPNGLVCTAGRCVPPCDDATSPCKAGQECVDGHCKVPGGCLDASECPLAETYCDPEAHTCKPGCLTDFDCKQSAKRCEGGKCIEKGCPGNFYCAFGEVCSKASGTCEAAQGPYCDPCDQQAEGQCGGGQNLCIGFQDQDGNALGDFCLVECGADPDNPCPQGYACEVLELEEGDKRNLCVRNCPVPAVGGGAP